MARNNIVDLSSLPPLPADIAEDLKDAFDDKEQGGCIGLIHFKNILHNFGFHSKSKTDMDNELNDKHDIKLSERTSFTFDEVKKVITYRLMKGKGMDEEAEEWFRLIDVRERTYVTAQDLKTTLSANLDVQVTEEDIAEFMEIAGADNGQLYLPNFKKLYL